MAATKMRLSTLLKDGVTLEKLVEDSADILSNSKKFTQSFEDSKYISVTHNLGRKPAVVVTDSAGTEYKGQVIHESSNKLIVKLLKNISGTVYCA